MPEPTGLSLTTLASGVFLTGFSINSPSGLKGILVIIRGYPLNAFPLKNEGIGKKKSNKRIQTGLLFQLLDQVSDIDLQRFGFGFGECLFHHVQGLSFVSHFEINLADVDQYIHIIFG